MTRPLPGLSTVTHGCHTLGAGCVGILTTNVSMTLPNYSFKLEQLEKLGQQTSSSLVASTSCVRLQKAKLLFTATEISSDGLRVAAFIFHDHKYYSFRFIRTYKTSS